ncbi:ABC-2 type transport system permease protein [Thermomonospora echinospora]|uniref:ABC-2 type transport system permease protein n=1 Tax=Thermomonospora echinospora TaxID=1992 RepID=A0A1H5Z4Q3_9ACTN|nr:ABC transporter permease subunit [Thermomonospora echinospora]SEG30635.1 ABC-2 type transport system permease protein [Thermomonospora echinospora]
MGTRTRLNGDGPATAARRETVPTVRRTLPLRVEAVRQLRRRRTLVAFAILLVLPWVLVAAFQIGGDPGREAPGLVTVATASAMNFALFALFVSAGFLLVVAVALFCGDTVAAEAGWSSLRYLLAAPVPRARLLRQKLVVALGYAALAVFSLPAMSLLAGTVAFGWGAVELPTGGTVPAGTALGRMAVIVGYALVSQLVVAALAFLLSVTTDSPLGAVGGAVGLVIVSNILDAVTALGGVRDFLPTHWSYSWMDALQPQIQWTGMAKGTAISVAYSVVLLALAFRRFRGKDVVS